MAQSRDGPALIGPSPSESQAKSVIELKTNKRPRTNRYNLTRRETEVLRLLAKGNSNTQIASRLGISPHTVKSHVINIFN
jgi:DNA-binding NarL/FixJ family response regulator